MKKYIFLSLLLFSGVALAQTQGQVLTNKQRTAVNDLIDEKLAYVNVKEFGVVGDGVTDDTEALQLAFNSATNLIGNPSDIYLVSEQSTKSVGVFGSYHYVLEIPSGTKFNMNGATIKLGNAQNSVIFINKNAGASLDSLIEISNGTIDGNYLNQTSPASAEMPCIFLYYVKDVRVYDIRVKNARDYAGRFLNVDGGYFNNLRCETTYGDAWSFGTTVHNQAVRNSFIDNIYATDCKGLYGSLQGNPMVITAQNTIIGKLIGENSKGGIKFQDLSFNLSIGQVIYKGGVNSGPNSGVKIQGNITDALYPTNISIGSVISSGCYGEGLKILVSKNVYVGSYQGDSNATSGVLPDVWLEGKNTIINDIVSKRSGSTGVLIRTDAEDYRINNISVTHCNGAGVSISSTHYGYIGSIFADDTTGNMTYALYNTSTGTGRCDYVYSKIGNQTTQPRIRVATGNYNYQIGEFISSSDIGSGRVQLTNGATSTFVQDTNIVRIYAGASDYLQPIIEVTPYTGSGKSLKSKFRTVVRDYTAGSGFTIYHDTASTTDYVYWKVKGWQVMVGASGNSGVDNGYNWQSDITAAVSHYFPLTAGANYPLKGDVYVDTSKALRLRGSSAIPPRMTFQHGTNIRGLITAASTRSLSLEDVAGLGIRLMLSPSGNERVWIDSSGNLFLDGNINNQPAILVADTTATTDGYSLKYIGGEVVWSPDIAVSGSGVFRPDGVTIDTTAGGLARVKPSKVTQWDSVSVKLNKADSTIYLTPYDASVAYATKSHTHTEFFDTLAISFGVMDTVITGDYSGWKVPNNITITEISAYTNSGSVTFNIEERGETTPNTTGTDLMGSDLVADTDQQEQTSFTNPTLDRNDWLVMNVTSTSGDPTIFGVTIRYVKTN